jgi:hypothetical protein
MPWVVHLQIESTGCQEISQPTAWNEEMWAQLKYLPGVFDPIVLTPVNKKTSINISDDEMRQSEKYYGNITWDDGVDVIFHILILDIVDSEYHTTSSNIGYFRLVNFEDYPRIYVYIANENGVREKISNIFLESKILNAQMYISFDYDHSHLREMKDEHMVGNKEVNNIPITSIEIYT